jgi:hypothetical protein
MGILTFPGFLFEHTFPFLTKLGPTARASSQHVSSSIVSDERGARRRNSPRVHVLFQDELERKLEQYTELLARCFILKHCEIQGPWLLFSVPTDDPRSRAIPTPMALDNLTEIRAGFTARSSGYDQPRHLLASLSTCLRRLKNLVFVALITTIGANRGGVLVSGENRSSLARISLQGANQEYRKKSYHLCLLVHLLSSFNLRAL